MVGGHAQEQKHDEDPDRDGNAPDQLDQKRGPHPIPFGAAGPDRHDHPEDRNGRNQKPKLKLHIPAVGFQDAPIENLLASHSYCYEKGNE